MRNITVSVTDKAYKTARLWAINHNTSISGVLQIFIASLDKIPFSADIDQKISHARRVAIAQDRLDAYRAVEPGEKPASLMALPPPDPDANNFLVQALASVLKK